MIINLKTIGYFLKIKMIGMAIFNLIYRSFRPNYAVSDGIRAKKHICASLIAYVQLQQFSIFVCIFLSIILIPKFLDHKAILILYFI